MTEQQAVPLLTNEQRRAIWRQHWREYWAWSAEWDRRGHPMPYEDPAFHAQCPVFPEVCRDLTCGAKTKQKGTPCKRIDLYGSGRCKYHGGLSSGPKTSEGKARSAANVRVRWARYRAMQERDTVRNS